MIIGVFLEQQQMIKFGNNSVFDTFMFNKFSKNGTCFKDNTICYINNDITDLEYHISKINNYTYKTQLRYRIKYYNELIKNINTFYDKM
jgi:hypothetical protein